MGAAECDQRSVPACENIRKTFTSLNIQMQQKCPFFYFFLESDDLFLKDSGTGSFFYPFNEERLLRSGSCLQRKPVGVSACECMVTVILTVAPESRPASSQHHAAAPLRPPAAPDQDVLLLSVETFRALEPQYRELKLKRFNKTIAPDVLCFKFLISIIFHKVLSSQFTKCWQNGPRVWNLYAASV